MTYGVELTAGLSLITPDGAGIDIVTITLQM